MAVLSVGFGWAVAGRVLAPLHRMTATARKLSEENLHERIALEGPDDELKELADTFDAMLGRLESAFDSQKRFVANASHELRTPLSIMRTEVDVALANPDATPDELRRMGEVVRRATERSDALIDGLLVLARSDRGPAALTPVDLAALAEEALAQAAAEAAAAGVELATRFEPGPDQRRRRPARAPGREPDRERHTPQRTRRPHRGCDRSCAPTPARSAWRSPTAVAVIDAADVDGLFEPFRRLGADRVAGRGAGLGLSIVRSVAVAHGGPDRRPSPAPEAGWSWRSSSRRTLSRDLTVCPVFGHFGIGEGISSER